MEKAYLTVLEEDCVGCGGTGVEVTPIASADTGKLYGSLRQVCGGCGGAGRTQKQMPLREAMDELAREDWRGAI
jgi:DnaJ-class molecular chaperone